ncbi:DUF6752 domain-containing protein [Nocardioides caeni]|uniref:DUF6752 domain-containing protein n=1 Tax=Nocardioides caeni TaxID=574700 RepID=A0A4S8NNX8_9ACTN|nr:DUF6752 domain-containing protein [Nocardioides caeni]THV18181.1 hypothetical protein E9934_00580 [Nocardioides caeni]
MTRTVHLHVGSPKSGTTYLQRLLDANRGVLADSGVLVVGRNQGERVRAGLQVREDARWQEMEPRPDHWGDFVREIRAWQGHTAVLSYELLSAATAEQAQRVFDDLAGLDVHVVITGRDLGRAVPSAWQERLKFGLTTPLEEWSPPPASNARSEWGWRTIDPASVAERWTPPAGPDHLHLVTVPRSPAAPDELWRRFADACGLSGIPVDLELPRVNESLGAVGAELLRRFNERLRPPLVGSAERARWLRDLMAHQIIAQRDDVPLAMTDEHLRKAERRSAATIEALTAAGCVVHGDLEDLRASRSTGRMPSDVSDAEVLDAALDALLELLLVHRSAAGSRGRGRGGAGGSRLSRWVRSATGPVVRQRDEALRRRLDELEREVQEARELQQRVAMLQDVVTELVLPADARNRDVTLSGLRRYRRNSL